jgi:hypothetical protein
MNIFERASLAKLRFESEIGALTTENLWDLPLTGKRTAQVDLDKLARGVNRELKEIEDGSFVNTAPDPRKTELELKLDILKHVIAAKIAQREAAEKAASLAERKRKLLAVLASKEEQELVGKSKEEIEAEIAALEAA